MIDKGKISGKLATHDVDNAVLDMEDFDIDNLEKLYKLLEEQNIEIVDELNNENFDALADAIQKARPASAKGTYILSCTISGTMTPGLKINLKEVVKVTK